MLLADMKKPPAEKKVEIKVPIVAVESVEMRPMQLQVESQGVVTARYETRLVAQVGGEIVKLSDEFVRGGFVKKGQLLARIDPNDYEAALIEAESNLASAHASLELEQAQGRVAEEEWKNISGTKPSELGLRRPQLRQEQARVKAAKAAVKRAKRNLERTEVVAPFDALIDSRNIGLGSYVGTGTELGKLFSSAVADVRLPISASEMQYLNANGVDSQVTLVANMAGQSVSWPAKIVRSEGVVDTKSRMTYLVAEVNSPYQNQTQPLRFGTYVTATIKGIELANAALVSRRLLDQDNIATLSDDNKLRFKKVTVLRQEARKAVITEGLQTGDRIITTALGYPIEGMDLELRKAVDNDNDKAIIDSESQVVMK